MPRESTLASLAGSRFDSANTVIAHAEHRDLPPVHQRAHARAGQDLVELADEGCTESSFHRLQLQPSARAGRICPRSFTNFTPSSASGLFTK